MKTKIPFQYQVTEFSCISTTIINGLLYLFPREHLPDEVLAKIWQYSTDIISGNLDKDCILGVQVSAVELIISCLNAYAKMRPKTFNIECTHYFNEKVHLKRGSKILKCRDENIAVLTSLCCDEDYSLSHAVLAIDCDDDWVYFFDPYFTLNEKRFPKEVIRVKNEQLEDERIKGQGWNLKIKRSYLDIDDCKIYNFGPLHDRQCIMFEKVQS